MPCLCLGSHCEVLLLSPPADILSFQEEKGIQPETYSTAEVPIVKVALVLELSFLEQPQAYTGTIRLMLVSLIHPRKVALSFLGCLDQLCNVCLREVLKLLNVVIDLATISISQSQLDLK